MIVTLTNSTLRLCPALGGQNGQRLTEMFSPHTSHDEAVDKWSESSYRHHKSQLPFSPGPPGRTNTGAVDVSSLIDGLLPVPWYQKEQTHCVEQHLSYGVTSAFIATIHTGTMMSGKPSCFSTPTTSSPALKMISLMMSRWRMTQLSMGSSLQPCRAMLSFRTITPLGRRLFLQRIRKFIRSLSVRWPEKRRPETRNTVNTVWWCSVWTRPWAKGAQRLFCIRCGLLYDVSSMCFMFAQRLRSEALPRSLSPGLLC